MSVLNHDNKDFWLFETTTFYWRHMNRKKTELEAAPDLADASLVCVLT